MIGEDFEKIHFEFLGLDLVEPMALISDTIMAIISLYFAFQVRKMTGKHPFYQYWTWFYLVFGIGAFFGGLGHVLFNYTGVAGKVPGWALGPISVYCVEQALISVHPNHQTVGNLKVASFWKMVVVYVIFILIVSLKDLSNNVALGFMPIALNSILGVSLTCGVLAQKYYRSGGPVYYRYFVLGVFLMIPSAFAFLLKINLHPWFDKNDMSHVFMTTGIIYFYLAVRKLHKNGFHKDAYI